MIDLRFDGGRRLADVVEASQFSKCFRSLRLVHHAYYNMLIILEMS